MGSKKCKVIQPIETVTSWEVVCPYCGETNYPEINDDVDWDTAKCEECEKTFIVNLKDYLKNIRQGE